MSDVSISAGPNFAPFVLSLESYFVIGLLASLLPNIKTRRFLAAVAHIAIAYAADYLISIGMPAGTASGFILVMCILYFPCWIFMLLGNDPKA